MTPPEARARILVLASGGGSNLGALLAHLDSLGDRRRADVACVASDRRGAGALARARARGIEAIALATRATPDGEPLDALVERVRPDLIVLAGYLRLVPLDIVRRYHGRMLNVHPALLPAFGGTGMYGLRVHQAVIDAGARVTGPTVHFVDEVYDEGAILAQWPVAVVAGDTAESLAARVLVAEHALYPRLVHAVAAGAVSLGSDGRVQWREATPLRDPRFILSAPEDRDVPGAQPDATMELLYPNP